MKANTTSAGVKNGICQQVIQINQHGQPEDNRYPFPVVSEKDISNNYWCYKMEKVVKPIDEYRCVLHMLKSGLPLSMVK